MRQLMDGQMEKFRNELKYVCTEAELRLLHSRIQGLCSSDSHVNDEGIYRIRSVYFDDRQNRCYYENEDGVDPREKFRIRSYNASREKISLECKKKVRGMTAKEQCTLSMKQYEQIMSGNYTASEEDPNLLRKFSLLQSQRGFAPKVIVCYERTPFVYRAGNVRITFDRNIGSSTDFGRFFDPELPVRPILPVGKQVLEVKYDAFLPDYLYSAMNLGSLQRTTFSKYYLCRKFAPKERKV